MTDFPSAGLPYILGALLKGLIAKKAKENVEATLQGIKKAAETAHHGARGQRLESD